MISTQRPIGRLVDPDLNKALMLADLLKKDDKTLVLDIQDYLTFNHLEQISGEKPVFAIPSREFANARFVFGTVADTNHNFGISSTELMRGLLVVGTSGSGKTNCCMNLIPQLEEEHIPYGVIDWKRNYRDLLIASNRKLIVFTVGRDVCPFQFNPLIPPNGTSTSVWLTKITEIMSHAYVLGAGVAYLLFKTFESVYASAKAESRWPTFRDVHGYLRNYDAKGRESQWLASTLRAVAMLCFGEMDRILNHGNFRVNNLLERNVVWELDALDEQSKIFFTEALLLWLHRHRLAEQRREILKHVLFIEEAHHMVSRRLESLSGSETVTDVLLREIRETGQAIVLIDQNPSLLSIPALGNTYTTICIGLKEYNDCITISSAMSLKYYERDILTKLKIGDAIVKLQGRYPEPFLIRIPKFPIEKGFVTDEMLRQKMAWFYKEFDKTAQEMGSIQEIGETSSGIKEGDGKKKFQNAINRIDRHEKQLKDIELSDEEKALLTDIISNQLSKVKERFERLQLDAAKGNRIRQKLETGELIKTTNLPSLEKRGYWGKALELTEKGRATLQQLGLKLPDEESKRKGGLLHQHYLRLIAEKFQQQGHEVKIEQPLGKGEATDILVDEQLAVEFERSDRNTLQNVRKNLEKGFRVLILAETAAVQKHIVNLLKQNDIQDAHVMGLQEFGRTAAGLIPSLFSTTVTSVRPSARKSSHIREKPEM